MISPLLLFLLLFGASYHPVHLPISAPTRQAAQRRHMRPLSSLWCVRMGATALARGRRGPDQDTLPDRTRALYTVVCAPPAVARSWLQKLGLRVACLVTLVRHKDYHEKDATPRPSHARNTISQRGTGASQSRNWLAARRAPIPGGQEAHAGKRPSQRQA